MNRIGATMSRDIEDALDIEVGLACGCRPNMICLIRFGHVQSRTINIGEDCNRGDAKLAAGANHAYCNLAAISDEDLFE